MRDAFAMFAPYKDVRKVTIFGSARTTKDDPLYEQARSVARTNWPTPAGWSITGAGPGIMEAGMRAPAASARSACRSGCRSRPAPTR